MRKKMSYDHIYIFDSNDEVFHKGTCPLSRYALVSRDFFLSPLQWRSFLFDCISRRSQQKSDHETNVGLYQLGTYF